MRMHRRLSAFQALVPILASVAAGCAGPTRPGAPDIELRLDLSGTWGAPGKAVVVSATIANRGNVPVLFHGVSTCGKETGIWFEVLGPEDGPVYFGPPVATEHCVEIPTTFRPGESGRSTFRFEGTVYDLAGLHAAPPGEYTIVARFWYGPSGPHPLVLERRAHFHWSRGLGTE